MGQMGENTKGGEGLLPGEVALFLQGLVASPFIEFGPSGDNGVIDFRHLLALEGTIEGAGDRFVFGKEEDAASGTIQSMSGVDVLPEEVADKLHADHVFWLGLVSRVDEVAGLLIDGDEGVVFEEDFNSRLSHN